MVSKFKEMNKDYAIDRNQIKHMVFLHGKNNFHIFCYIRLLKPKTKTTKNKKQKTKPNNQPIFI